MTVIVMVFPAWTETRGANAVWTSLVKVAVYNVTLLHDVPCSKLAVRRGRLCGRRVHFGEVWGQPGEQRRSVGSELVNEGLSRNVPSARDPKRHASRTLSSGAERRLLAGQKAANVSRSPTEGDGITRTHHAAEPGGTASCSAAAPV